MSSDCVSLELSQIIDDAAGQRSFAAHRSIGTEAIAAACAALFLIAMAAIGLAPERHPLDATSWELRGSIAGASAH